MKKGILNLKRNIKFVVEYDGSAYAGWQRLGNEVDCRSIQSVLEEKLSNLLKEKINITASGRTDSGVHALGQVANFFCNSQLPLDEMKNQLNILLSEDIKVKRMEEADMNFHSRYSAKAKTYEYRIEQNEKPSVFTRKYTYHYPVQLNVDAMKSAAAWLIGTHDFKAFSTDRREDKPTQRTIENIQIYHYQEKDYYKPSNELRFAITGDGFLYNMVRIIVGTLLEVGEGKRQPEEMKDILESKSRKEAGKTVSSIGLFLKEVKY
jgi:tRNA pseudouridine38-40 synthase